MKPSSWAKKTNDSEDMLDAHIIAELNKKSVEDEHAYIMPGIHPEDHVGESVEEEYTSVIIIEL